MAAMMNNIPIENEDGDWGYAGDDVNGAGGGCDNRSFYQDVFDDSHKAIDITSMSNEISIAWRNLRIESESFGGMISSKVILRRLNGHFRYHTLNGLMGPSGAGKTTLLNCLTGNVRHGVSVDSEIYLNKRESTSVVSYFVEQHVHESVIARLTVGDTFRYAYRFKNRNDYSSSSESMEEYIRKIVRELMLDELVLDRRFENCSGGEQKRIAIGQELMSRDMPSLLFVDEPTTGLDSNAALVVMNCLKRLTYNYRMTIIASIHLPNEETLMLFDKLYVLAKGGVCVYSGAPSALERYLSEEIFLITKQDQQPIEALLKVACNGLDDPNVINLANLALASEYQQVEERMHQIEHLPHGLPTTRRSFTFTDFFWQLCRQLQTTFVCDIRQFAWQLILFALYFVVLSTIFDPDMARPRGCYPYDDANSTCKDELINNSQLTENFNYLAFSTLIIGILLICTSAIIFSPMVKVFRSEHRNRWYSVGVFYWSASVVSLLQMIILIAVSSVMCYFMTQQHVADDYNVNWNRLMQFFFIMLLLSIYITSVGQMFGSIFVDEVEVAIIICQILYTFMAMLSGFYFNIEKSSIRLLHVTADLLVLKFVTKYTLYVIYGIDRCDPQLEYSLVLEENFVDEKLLTEYVIRLVINIVVIRCFTLLLLYWKFNTFTPIRRCGSCKPDIASASCMIRIDYRHEVENSVKQLTTKSEKIASPIVDERSKTESEIEFEKFSRHKVIIAWRNLSLYATSSIYEIGSVNMAKPRKILRGLNGEFRFGTMNALMGTSGAGKTTLLKVLNGRQKTRLSAETSFYLSRFTKIVTCYLTQEVSGHLWPGLTAKQMLIYASRLKNQGAESGTKIDHEERAKYLLRELSIMDTENTRTENCSGGERKRLALALELTSLQMPNLICIDEPTSGLDSNSSEIVMSCLAQLAEKHNLTIIASIHQPNAEVLQMFDQLYVLARGGVCVYSGPPKSIRQHLAAIPEANDEHCRIPIEILIKHSCLGHRNSIVKQLRINNDKKFNEAENLGLCDEVQFAPEGVMQNRSRFSSGSVYILFLRYIRYVFGHQWKQWIAYICIYIGYGFSLRLLFDSRMAFPSGCIRLDEEANNTCSRTAAKIQEDDWLSDNFKYNFFMNIILLFIILVQTSLNFSREVVYFYNEHRNGWYSSGAFYLMKSLIETIPVFPIIVCHIMICNIYEPVKPGIGWYLIALLTLGAISLQGMAHVFSLIANGNITVLTSLSIGLFLLSELLSNFFVRMARLHYLYKFLSNFSIARFLFESCTLLQYGFGRCTKKEVQKFLYLMKLENEDFVFAIQMLFFNLIFYRLVAIWMLVVKSNATENRRERSERVSNYQLMLQAAKTLLPGMDTNYQFRLKKIQF